MSVKPVTTRYALFMRSASDVVSRQGLGLEANFYGLGLTSAPMALASKVQALALIAALTIIWHHLQMQER